MNQAEVLNAAAPKTPPRAACEAVHGAALGRDGEKSLRTLLLLLVPLALHSGRAAAVNDFLQDRTARSPPLLDGTSLAVETRASGLSALGPYRRHVVVRRAGAPVGEGELGNTLAAVWAINVHQTGPRDLVLAHRPQAFDADTTTGAVRPQPRWGCGEDRPDGAIYPGVFDSLKGRKLPFRFIPASEREERPMLQAPEMC